MAALSPRRLWTMYKRVLAEGGYRKARSTLKVLGFLRERRVPENANTSSVNGRILSVSWVALSH
jgi:hypothetical protein